MGRHSLSYIAAQQALSPPLPPVSRTASYVGRVGLLAVALGIGAAVAGGTAIAGADTPSSNGTDDRPAQSSTAEDNATNSTATKSRGEDEQKEASDDDPASAPPSSLQDLKDPTDDAAEVDPEEAAGPEAAPAEQSRAARSNSSSATPELTTLEVPKPSATSTIAAVDPEVPSPTDQATTEYGEIGKWMLQWNGEIADYGGLPYEGKTVLEPVNVIIVDPTSKTALGAALRLNAAMRRAGFPPRFFHSTGFRGLIDDQRYRQQPRGLLVGYSDDFFLATNNHGRIFGPDPVETSSGFVWSGAFSREELAFINGLPRHTFVSSNQARDALAAKLVASGRATLGGSVSLNNAYNTDTTTTGDHDGYAVVLVLNNPYAVRASTLAAGEATSNRTCAAAGASATSTANMACALVTVATVPRPQ